MPTSPIYAIPTSKSTSWNRISFHLLGISFPKSPCKHSSPPSPPNPTSAKISQNEGLSSVNCRIPRPTHTTTAPPSELVIQSLLNPLSPIISTQKESNCIMAVVIYPHQSSPPSIASINSLLRSSEQFQSPNRFYYTYRRSNKHRTEFEGA